MWGAIASFALGLVQAIWKMFQKKPEEVVREAYEKKEVSAINSVATGDEHGLVVSDSANSDKWEIAPVRPATSIPAPESPADGGDTERPKGSA